MPTYSLKPTYFLIHDCPQPEVTLKTLFQDSHTLFRMRVQKLGSISKRTTPEETNALRIMLEALIETKQQLQNQG
jgi:hypothetical protein